MIDARAVALQGIGFSSLLVAVQGFGDVAVVERRGGTATLRRIRDGKAHAVGGRALTHANFAGATGVYEGPILILVIPGAVTAVGKRSQSHVHAVKARATAKLMVSGTQHDTSCAPVRGSGHTNAYATGARSYSIASEPTGAGTATVQLQGVVSIASANDVPATGKRRLTPAKLAAIVASY
jgi:hypothetical protein